MCGVRRDTRTGPYVCGRASAEQPVLSRGQVLRQLRVGTHAGAAPPTCPLCSRLTRWSLATRELRHKSEKLRAASGDGAYSQVGYIRARSGRRSRPRIRVRIRVPCVPAPTYERSLLRVACSFRLIALKPASQYQTRPSAPCAAQCVGCGMLHGAWADAVAHDRTRHGVGPHLSLLRHGCARARHRVSHVRRMPRCARSSASPACSGLTVAFCGHSACSHRYDLYDQRGPEVRLYMRVGHLCCMFAWLGYAVGRDQRSYLPTPSIATARLRVNAPREGGDSPLWRAEVQFSLRAEITHFAA